MQHQRYVRFLALAGVLLIVAAACGGSDASNAAPARQIDLAPSKAANPQLADAPLPSAAPAKAPVKKPQVKPVPPPYVEVPGPRPVAQVPAPASTPRISAPATGTIATGSTLTLNPSSRICTNTHKAGDRFTATLASAVYGTNGLVVPSGAAAALRVIESTKKAGGKDSLLISYDVVSVKVGDDTYEVVSHVTQSTPLEGVSSQSTTDKATKIGGGAAVGAIIGQIIGKNTKGTVIGGVVGAATGAVVANNTKDWNGCLTEASVITISLDRPLTIRLAPKP